VLQRISSLYNTQILSLCGIMISFMIWMRFWALHLGDDDGFGWVGVLWVAQKLDDGFGWFGFFGWYKVWLLHQKTILTSNGKLSLWQFLNCHLNGGFVAMLERDCYYYCTLHEIKMFLKFPFQQTIQGWCRSRIWSKMSAKLNVSRLRKELSKRGLDTSGLKPALVCF
jgi:hypothetical protein